MNLSGNKLTCNLSGQSSQLTEPLWTDPGIKSRIMVSELISISKKKKKKKPLAGNEWWKVLAKSLQAREKPSLSSSPCDGEE